MNRNVPLQARAGLTRNAPLARNARLAAGAGLETRAALSRTVPIRPVSPRRARENRQRSALIDQLWPGRIVVCWRPGCLRLADDVHEILTRARGGSITDPANWAPLCRQCHTEVTDEAPWAYDAGLLRHSWEAA